MNWLQHMNWTFLEDEDAVVIWDEARRHYFENDETLDAAFTLALKSKGVEVSDDTKDIA